MATVDQIRQDIQFLRGYAVSIVILDHAELGPAAGYLGVDIFFVISGYLITKMVQAQLRDHRFSFAEFYMRRAKRLLPAAFATFALTAFAAPLFLNTAELESFKAQLLGAVTFSANIVLWQQSGYFDPAAELKPLLHIWSLSLEEQYYFLLPAALFLIGARHWLRMAWTFLLLSAALCGYLVIYSPDAAFFLLPSRAWELTIGSLLALAQFEERLRIFFKRLFAPSLAVLALLPFFPTGFAHPGIDAALVCAATAAVIMRGSTSLGRSRATRWLAWIGNPSYSLSRSLACHFVCPQCVFWRNGNDFKDRTCCCRHRDWLGNLLCNRTTDPPWHAF